MKNGMMKKAKKIKREIMKKVMVTMKNSNLYVTYALKMALATAIWSLKYKVLKERKTFLR